MQNRFFSFIILTLMLSLSFAQDDTVDGYVILADSLDAGGTHEGVQVTFYNLPSMDMETFGVSDEDGYYSFPVGPGFYSVQWTKDGYVPWELGGVTVGGVGDITLDPVTLIPGEVITVTGEQSGNWTTAFQYWVQETVTVPEDSTLTIDAGVRVKFLEGAGMVCNGTLEVNGTEDERVLFTSQMPTPLPGDWDNVELYGENNIISYLDYEYADDGFTGDGASGSSFDHLEILGTLSLTANGIYLTNSSDMSFTNNQITVTGNELIYCSEAANSTFSGNELIGTSNRGIYANNASGSVVENNSITLNDGAEVAIEMDSCHDCSFDNNIITNLPSYGIMVRYSDVVSFTNNNLDVSYTGFHCSDGSNHIYDNNTVTNFDEYGINFNCSENATVTNNNLTTDTGGGWKVGIKNDCGTPNATINNNYVKVENGDNYLNHIYGILVHDSEIDSNEVEVYQYDYHFNEAIGILAHRSIITNNTVYAFDCCENYGYYGFAIRSNGDSDNRSMIEGNTITADDETRGIWASYADISNNTITGINNNEWAIGGGSENIVQDNTISNMREGLYLNEYTDWVVSNNVIQVHTDNGIYMNNSNGTFTYNLIISGGTGVHCENQSGAEFSNNIIIGNGGDYGVVIANLSTPVVRNNIIQGFQNGIYDDNALANYNLAFNNFWDISNNLFEGINLPALIGEMIDENANADLSDIYSNINLNPMFVAPDADDYSLQAASPCINAGDPSTTDPDGTVADIGAYYYHIYVLVEHTPLGVTSDTQGPYAVTATAYSPAEIAVNASLFYRVNDGDFTELAMTDLGDDNFTADIPGQDMNSQIDYYILASEGDNVAMDPPGAPDETYSFLVSMLNETAALSGYSRPDATIDLYWDEPSYLDEVTPTALLIYRSTSSGLTQDDLVAQLDPGELGYYDDSTVDGETYYYALGVTADVSGETHTAMASGEIMVFANEEATLSITGHVLLEGADDHSGVHIEFERYSPTQNYYTATTQSDGSFGLSIPNGLYNISFSVFGWQPYELNSQLIEGNIEYEIELEQGFAAYVEGYQSGQWTEENLYFVMGDIIVTENDTLNIEAGTRIKFTGLYDFTVDGVLIAEGDSLNHIEFTSNQTTPFAGDWGTLTLHSPGNILRYVDVSYADNGITGEDIDGSIFDHCSVSEIPRWPEDDMQRYNCHGIEAGSCLGCEFTYNSVDGFIWEGIMVENDGSGSIFIGNEINLEGSLYGIAVMEGDSITFANNEVTTDATSIWVGEGSYLSFTDNTISSSGTAIDVVAGSDYVFTGNTISSGGKGINTPLGSNLVIENNEITSDSQGIEIRSVGSGFSVSNNAITSNNAQCIFGDYSKDGGVIDNNICYAYNSYGIEMDNSDDCEFTNNTIYAGSGIASTSSSGTTIEQNTLSIDNGRGIYVDNSDFLVVLNNTVSGFTQYGILFNSGNNTAIHDNELISTPNNQGGNYGIYNSDTSSDGNEVYDNLIHIQDAADSNGGIRVSNVQLYGNSITIGGGGNNIYGIVGQKNTIHNNDISIEASGSSYAIDNTCDSSNRSIHDNQIELIGASGIRGDRLNIYDNTMSGSSDGTSILIYGEEGHDIDIYNNTLVGGIAIYDETTAHVHHNLIKTSGNGLEVSNNAGGEFYNNTFAGNSDSTGTGLYIHDFVLEYQDLYIENNIFTDFNMGVNVENQISAIGFNTIHGSITTNFTGAGLPNGFGAETVENYNGTLGDFYGNLFLSPQYVMPDSGNYNLQLISPCINAGSHDVDHDGIDYPNDEDDIDPDGTALDMGAFYRDASILEDVFGCTDVVACNYNEFANQDNGSCSYPTTWYWDEDGDGLGSSDSYVESCVGEVPDGFVDNADDSEPECATNDTDDCDVCGGANVDMDCTGVCFGLAVDDDCGQCVGGTTTNEQYSCGSTPCEINWAMDCNGECFGDAEIDGCSDCVGGSTELEPCLEDCAAVSGGDAYWDDCGQCVGGTTTDDQYNCGGTPCEMNWAMDCAGVCYGEAVNDSFDGCCALDDVDECAQCNGNGWDMCDEDGDGAGNLEQWGYGVHGIGISDIQDDQGGWVLMNFNRSFYDTDSLRTIEIYTIERWDDNHWTSLSSISAYGSDVYYTEARTAIDSTGADDGLTLFRVIANMDEGNFENLEEAWGYSVDNISPSAPEDLFAAASGNDVYLGWSYAEDLDFDYHMVSDIDDNQTYTIENDIIVPLEISYNEYHVNSVDTHENLSDDSQYASAYNLDQGANLISFSVLPEDNSIDNVMTSLDVTGVITEGVASSYIPELGWIGSLDSIEPHLGYWVKSSSGEVINTSGTRNQITSFDLHYGPNLISYTCDESSMVEDVIINPEITGILGQGVATTYDSDLGWLGSLTTLDPGRGYWFKSDADISLDYDCPSQGADDLSSRIVVPPIGGYAQSTQQAFYFFGDVEGIETGDIIRSYHGDHLVGARAWLGAYSDVPAMGLDFQAETQGYAQEGSPVRFTLQKQGGGEVALSGSFPLWSGNGIFIIENANIAPELPESYSLNRVYPNPFNPSTTIEFSIPELSWVSVSVYDIKGVEVARLVDQSTQPGHHSTTWNAADHASGVYIIKISANGFSDTQKIMLLK